MRKVFKLKFSWPVVIGILIATLFFAGMKKVYVVYHSHAYYTRAVKDLKKGDSCMAIASIPFLVLFSYRRVGYQAGTLPMQTRSGCG